MLQPTLSDDASLVVRCRQGDPLAWEALVRRYQRLVHAIVRNAGLDDQSADDVFQTVFLRLLQQLTRIAEPSRLQAWIVTTAKREAWLQRKQGMQLVSMTHDEGAPGDGGFDDIADDAPGPEASLAQWQMLLQVQLGLDLLDERCRRLLQALFEEDAEGYGEIGRRLAMPVGSIGPTRARCLDKLRRSIEQPPARVSV